ncbi:MAG: ParB/RepB/Spo0J family partition protein [Herminiimonas sp.]|nr:ParB/RepB/Spo0J family partition protein [Herminiimonas sp.]
MKKKSLLANLGASVAAQTVQARDKFDMADLTMAMKRASAAGGASPAAAAVSPAATSTPLLPRDQAPVARAMVTPSSQSLAELPISKVRDHPRNARHLYDPTRIDEMAASIARDGQMMPAIVMADPHEPETYLLIEGRYRKRALQSLGRETILAIVVDPLPELEAYRLSLILNEERNEQTDLDNAISWKMLQDDGLFTSQDHIAEYLGITQSKVSKTLSLLELPAGVLTIMKTSPGQFGLRIGYELRQLARQLAPPELETVAEQVRDGKLTVAALEKMRTRAEKTPVTRERSRAYPLKSGELTIGTLRDFDDGRLKIDLTGVTPAVRKALIAAVQQVLDAAPGAAGS